MCASFRCFAAYKAFATGKCARVRLRFSTYPQNVRFNPNTVLQSCGLKERMHDLIPGMQKEVKEFRAEHGSAVIGEVTVDQVQFSALALK